MGDVPGATYQRMRLRYAGTCRVCGQDLPAKTEALYERSTKTLRCLVHQESAEAEVDPEAIPREDVDPGTP